MTKDDDTGKIEPYLGPENLGENPVWNWKQTVQFLSR
jgi:hypothetical protein